MLIEFTTMCVQVSYNIYCYVPTILMYHSVEIRNNFNHRDNSTNLNKKLLKLFANFVIVLVISIIAFSDPIWSLVHQSV